MWARWRFSRWLLLMALGFGVALMHHAPALHAPSAHAHSPQASAMSHAGIAAVGHGVQSCCESPQSTSDSHERPAPANSALHLCVAILASIAAAACGFFLRRVLRPYAESRIRISTLGLRMELFRPPTSAPRRLAVLCVLRL